jgi:putative transposase
MEKEQYSRILPHIQPLGGLFFVTYVLNGSIPKKVLQQINDEHNFSERKRQLLVKNDRKGLDELHRLQFKHIDNYLAKTTVGHHYFKDERLAKIIVDTLHFWDNKRIELICYCIMSNHVHTVFRLLDDAETIDYAIYLHKFMHSIKSFSAKRCNELLNISGQFWQEESYDRLIRDKNELYRIISYVLDNPVKAGLCQSRQDWKWSYIKEDYNEFL